MKSLSRIFSALLLCALLCTFTLWRKEALPDLTGVSDTLKNAMLSEDGPLANLLDKVTPDAGTQTPSHVDSQTVAGVSEALDALMSGAIGELQTEVNVSDLKMHKDEFRQQMELFFLTHPEFFFVSTGYHLSSHPNTELAVKVTLQYLYDAEQIPEMQTQYEQTLQQIVSGIPQGYGQFDQVLYLHDYLVQNFAYDYVGLRQEEMNNATSGVAIRDAYRFFTEGRGVCQGYTLAFMALCAELDIRNVPVTCEALNHVWNLVEVDGEWYHVDVTHDDPGGEQSVVYPSYVSYEFFLLSNKALYALPERNHIWQASQKAESKLYDDAVWHAATTPMVKYGDHYYCTLYQQNGVGLYGGAPTQMQKLTDLHADWGYNSAWAGLVLWQGALICNTQNAFYRYDLQTGESRMIGLLVPELGPLNIFGLCGISESGVITYVAASEYHGAFEKRTWTVPAA